MRTEETGWEKAQSENTGNMDGYYYGGFIVIVTRSDASNLADALENTLQESR